MRPRVSRRAVRDVRQPRLEGRPEGVRPAIVVAVGVAVARPLEHLPLPPMGLRHGRHGRAGRPALLAALALVLRGPDVGLRRRQTAHARRRSRLPLVPDRL